MHELFRYAPHVHTGPTEPPLGAMRRGLYEVEQNDLGRHAQVGGGMHKRGGTGRGRGWTDNRRVSKENKRRV